MSGRKAPNAASSRHRLEDRQKVSMRSTPKTYQGNTHTSLPASGGKGEWRTWASRNTSITPPSSLSRLEKSSSRRDPLRLQPSSRSPVSSKFAHKRASTGPSVRGGYEEKFAAFKAPETAKSVASIAEIQEIVSFNSPPLLEGLANSLKEVLGKAGQPTPIQALSMDHFFPSGERRAKSSKISTITLLASETGSGKSIAYLLPVIQSLKRTEMPLQPSVLPAVQTPRAVILAPTHELCRQLSSYAKSLCHETKLRTVCLSNPSKQPTSAIQAMRNSFNNTYGGPSVHRQPDIMVATPSRLAWLAGLEVITDEESPSAASRLKSSPLSRPGVSLEKLEWLVVDEADVLFDRDFRQSVEAILKTKLENTPDSYSAAEARSKFNVILSTATIPASLNNYLTEKYPSMTRLTSPNLHQLPKRLRTERVDTSDVHPRVAIHKKLVELRAADAMSDKSERKRALTRVIVFCNRSEKVDELASYLDSMGMPCLAMTGKSASRRKGSNNHLALFLTSSPPSKVTPIAGSANEPTTSTVPRVLITTSLLARGLDFAPSVAHVLIADEPRNEIDFLHRAGRTGRAGRSGTVVLFGKATSRGPKRVGFT